MKTNTCHASTCSKCRFFHPEGNMHGSCGQLHVTVDGEWPGCSLGVSAFAPIDELLAQLNAVLQEVAQTKASGQHLTDDCSPV
jgi:hypothetical protein